MIKALEKQSPRERSRPDCINSPTDLTTCFNHASQAPER